MSPTLGFSFRWTLAVAFALTVTGCGRATTADGPPKAEVVAFLNAQLGPGSGLEFTDLAQLKVEPIPNTPNRVVVEFRAAGRLSEDRFVPLAEGESAALLGPWTPSRWRALQREVEGFIYAPAPDSEQNRALTAALQHPPSPDPNDVLVVRAAMRRGQGVALVGSLSAERQMEHWRLYDLHPGTTDPALTGSTRAALAANADEAAVATVEEVRAAVPGWEAFERVVAQKRALVQAHQDEMERKAQEPIRIPAFH